MYAPGAYLGLLRGPSTSPVGAMNKITATAIALGAFVVGGCLGAYLSYTVSNEVLTARLAFYDLSNVDAMSMYAAVTRSMGTVDAYETALHELLRSIEARERENRPGGLLSERALSADKVLTYARLALLASERKDSVDAAKYWSQAQAVCPELQWTSCTADRLTDVVHEIDEHSVWNLKPSAPSGYGN
jgi:hypothetical protein